MAGRLRGVVLLALWAACSTPPARTREDAPAVAGRNERDPLRERSRAILEASCGTCHLPELDTSLPAALAVFDLSERDWSARMSDAQLRDAESRLGADLAPGGVDGVPLAVQPDDRATFARYVERETRRRAGTGLEPASAASSD